MFNFAFNSFYEALYMNGHGLYVWSVVILVFISLLGFFIGYTVKIKKIKDKLNEPKIYFFLYEVFDILMKVKLNKLPSQKIR